MPPANTWRFYPQTYRLEAARCKKCQRVFYPPRLVCPDCGARDFEPVVLPRDGKVATFTIIRVPPAGFTEQTPLPLAVVELSNGVRLMAQIADFEDPEQIEIGMPVRLEFRRVYWDGAAGVILYRHKAVQAS